jgi:outer membrane lipoprotein carrier protein
MDSERFSPLRRLGIKAVVLSKASIGIILAAGTLGVVAVAQDADRGGADDLRRFLGETHTLRASFYQELLGTDLEVVEVATGTFSLKRPSKFVWNYDAPIEQDIVADGTDLWIYDVELAQVTVTPIDESISATPAMLLSGNTSLEEGFEVLESFDAEGLRWVRLAPKSRDTDFREVLIAFRSGVLARLRLLDSLDQVTSIEFVDVELNPDLDDGMFEFSAPPDVDIIGGRG